MTLLMFLPSCREILSVIVLWKNLTYFLGLKGFAVKGLTCFRAVFDHRLSDKGGIFDTSLL